MSPSDGAATAPTAAIAPASSAPREGWTEVNDHCPIVRALDAVPTRSAFLILREAYYGATRFEQFAARAEISEPVAAARLRELADQGLLEKVPYREPGQRTRHEYRLTEKGTDLLPALVALFDWGVRWGFPDSAPRIALGHRDCDAGVHAELRCDRGHPVAPGEIQVRRPAQRSSSRPGGDPGSVGDASAPGSRSSRA